MSDIIVSLKAVLETTPVRWNNLTKSLLADLLRRQPAPGEWSAVECLQHLIDTERGVFPKRVRVMLAGEKSFPAFNPDQDGSAPSGDVSPEALAAEFDKMRRESLKLLDQVTPADLDRQATHGELGLVSLNELLHEWGGHDLMHTVQAEQALMQPFINGCGPWRVYFEKHVIDGRD